MMGVIRKPEITKKMSTPMKPPSSAVGNAWYSTTEPTAMARRPSMSGRYLGCIDRSAGRRNDRRRDERQTALVRQPLQHGERARQDRGDVQRQLLPGHLLAFA